VGFIKYKRGLAETNTNNKIIADKKINLFIKKIIKND
jgi:hypothetical protein